MKKKIFWIASALCAIFLSLVSPILLFAVAFLTALIFWRQFSRFMARVSGKWSFRISLIVVILFVVGYFSKASSVEAVGMRSLSTPLPLRLLAFAGIFALIFISWIFSANRKAIKWRPVIWGVILQLIFGLIVLSPQVGNFFFVFVDGLVGILLSFSEEGAAFVFGPLAYSATDPRGLGALFFAFSALPPIIVVSSLMTVLYHLGIMQIIVGAIAKVMQKTMKTSGAETLSAAGNIFVGQTEAPLLVKPFIKDMTVSELHAIMTGGFATVAGGVMAAYVMFLKDFIPNIAGHLVTASIMSAPAALAISKIMMPETEHSVTAGDTKITVEKPDSNVVEAAARGASEGMSLMINVIAMLIAFVAIVAGVNWTLEEFSLITSNAFGRNPHKIVLEMPISAQGDTIEVEGIGSFKVKKIKGNSVVVKEMIRKDFDKVPFSILSEGKVVSSGLASGKKSLFFVNLSIILGWLFAPISFLMGVPWKESAVVGKLLGEKLVLTEFIAYINLADVLKNGWQTASGEIIYLSQRSAVIASYALCGFANFASIGIQIGGIGGIAPNKRSTLAKIGLRAMFAGAIAACMTGTVAGILM